MIRRGLWLAAGAALGVTGYRRASRLLRPLTAPAAARMPASAPAALLPRRPAAPGRGLLAVAASAGRSTAQGIAFARDVRDGMAQYLDRQPVRVGRTLEGQRGGRRSVSQPDRAAPGGQRRAAP